MRVRESIVSGHAARQVIAIPDDKWHGVGHHSGGNWQYSLRKCWRKRDDAGHPIFSGGAVVGVRRTMEAFQHTTTTRQDSPVRLAAGWDRPAVSRAIFRIQRGLEERLPLLRLRESVFLKASGLSEADTDHLASTADGHPTIYDEMTEADCRYWIKRVV